MSDPQELNYLSAAVIGGVVGFVAGYQTSQQQTAQILQAQALELAEYYAWKPFIQSYQSRLGHLTYQRILKPLPAYDAVPALRMIFGEAVLAYLFGLSNSAVFSVGRSLEVALSTAYQNKMSTPKKLSLDELITWCESLDSGDKNVAASCRLLRNTIHSSEMVEEPTALGALRNCASILNKVYPYSEPVFRAKVQCTWCRTVHTCPFRVEQIFIGNVIAVICDSCKSQYNIQVQPV